jgi:hypothetical protein
MAADTSGIFRAMERVRRVRTLTSRGMTEEYAGIRRTSSKVSAFWTTRIEKLLAQSGIIRTPRYPVNGAKRPLFGFDGPGPALYGRR